VLSDDPRATPCEGPRTTEAKGLDVLDPDLLGPVQVHRVVDVAEDVQLVLAYGVADAVAVWVEAGAIGGHEPEDTPAFGRTT
jgi:hypothetical protein